MFRCALHEREPLPGTGVSGSLLWRASLRAILQVSRPSRLFENPERCADNVTYLKAGRRSRCWGRPDDTVICSPSVKGASWPTIADRPVSQQTPVPWPKTTLLTEDLRIWRSRAARPGSQHGRTHYSGALSFLRRRYKQDLSGVDVAVVGVPFGPRYHQSPRHTAGPTGHRARFGLRWPGAVLMPGDSIPARR